MTNLVIPNEHKNLFECILEPQETTADGLKGDNSSQAVVEVFRNKRNRVAIGLPYFENITSRARELDELPQEVKKTIKTHDFHLISLSCSFLPDIGCKFTWARFEVELSSTALTQEKPIAWDIYPSEITYEVNVASSITISPQLSFSLSGVDTNASLFSLSAQREYTSYVPQIFAFGFRTPRVVWDFKSTMQKGLWGDKRNLLLIVTTLRDSKLQGQFKVSAQVDIEKASFRLFLPKLADDLINRTYKLSR
jgi:hypothetical protein